MKNKKEKIWKLQLRYGIWLTALKIAACLSPARQKNKRKKLQGKNELLTTGALIRPRLFF